tara:strand:+ start:336 stop:1310 length:975 start_codon:yes stop_codon:yes gene_type:complete
MAGLSRNFLLKQKSFPDDPLPTYDNVHMQYYGSGQGSTSGNMYLPGFANDDGDYYGIKVSYSGGNLLNYYQPDGTQITSGSWNGGFYASEVTDGGGNNGNYFLGLYMDTTDNLLYGIAINTTANPDQVGLFHINKSGSLTLVGGSWRDTTAADDTTTGLNSTWVGPLRRTGGDGSGNFEINYSYTPSNNYRMKKYTFDVSSGAFTEPDIMPANYPGASYHNGIFLGPTTNNIIMTHAGQDTDSGIMYGSLLNTSTGKHTGRYTAFNNQRSGGGMSSWFFGTHHARAMYWRGGVYVGSGTFNVQAYDETDLYNYVDQMADYYGIL